MKQAFSMVRYCAVAATLGMSTIGISGSAKAAFITVANPGFQATVNHNFTFNSNSYVVGDDLPPGVYLNQINTVTQTNAIRKLSDTTTITSTGPGAPTDVTGTLAGWTPIGPRAGIANLSGVNVSGMTNVGEVGNLVTAFVETSEFRQDVPGNVQLQPLQIYILSMQLLKESAIPLSPIFLADLTVGGTPLNGTLLYIPATDLTPGSATVTYSSGLTPPSGDLGILIRATDNTAAVTKIMVDNVTLISIPEPSAAVLCSLGIMGMIFIGRPGSREFRKSCGN